MGGGGTDTVGVGFLSRRWPRWDKSRNSLIVHVLIKIPAKQFLPNHFKISSFVA